MNEIEAMAFLEETKKYGSQLGLTSIRNLMSELGNVQERVRVVHIGGTNGKGSVGAMLSAILTEAGYKVGRFNTPDVFSYEEEFLMDGEPIEKRRLAQLFTRVSETSRTLQTRGLPHPTRFEVETAAAFLWFYEEKCDLALVEVGMGGETDATNLITHPLVSVLTSISMDHMKFLGDSLAEIALVKAGIIKQGCPVVSMIQKPEVAEVIGRRATEMNAELLWADSNLAEDIRCTPEETSFSLNGNRMTLGLSGAYQIENAVCVLRVLEILVREYPQITSRAILAGMKNTRWPGRFEQIHVCPTVLLDGAHNEDAIKKLRKSLDLLYPQKRILYIMGVLADKEYDKMIQIMFQENDQVFTITPPNPRALSAEELAERLRAQKIVALPCEKPEDAVRYAGVEAGREDIILAFGSLYCMREVREAFQRIFT